MGGVVSTGQDNDDLIDNLKEAEYIKSTKVEQVFRIVDRAHYYLPESRESAYKDLAWKSGTLHLSAPCIYSEVMEALELEPGLSFLNIGSGTGYLNTMVGFMIGPYGINHGVELHEENVKYAEERLKEFKQIAKKFDDLEFCEPAFVKGNCLNLAPDTRRYDRVYCGAACPPDLKSTIQNLMKLQGILVMPVGDQLLKIKRTSEAEFSAENVLPVSFASLYVLQKEDSDVIVMPEVNPLSLQNQCAVVVREAIRKNFCFDAPSCKDPSKQNKREQANKIFHQDSVRLPLNFLPAAQRLMIMSAFGQSDESINSEGDADEQTDESLLDLQLQRYAQEVQRVSWRTRQGRRQENTEDIDSSLSDDEMSVLEEPTKESQTESSKDHLKSVSEDIGSMESEDGIVADDEQEDDDERDSTQMAISGGESSASSKRSNLTIKVNKNASKSKGVTGNVECNLNAASSKDTKKAYFCPSSDDEEEASGVDKSMKTGPIQVATSSHPRSCKTSYSTSAEASETSGFGSLGEDYFQIGSLQSSSVFLNDEEENDITDEASNDAGVFSCGNDDDQTSMRSSSLKNKMLQNGSTDKEKEGNQEEEVENGKNNECDKQKMDDEQGTSTGEDEMSSSDEESCEKKKKQVLFESRGPDFTAFLKTQVNTLPIPNTLKLFILRYR